MTDQMLPRLLLLNMAIMIGYTVMAQSSLQQFTPSRLLGSGQYQAKIYNNLYTQTKIRDKYGNNVDIGERQSFLNHQIRLLYGISAERKINIGLEMNATTAWYGSNSSGLLVASIGPTIKWVPLAAHNNFSIQSTFLLPINKNQLENPRFVNHKRYTWWTQLFYDHRINEHWNVFLELDVLCRFKVDASQNDFFRLPTSAILSYFATDRWTIYSNIQHSAAYGKLEGVENVPFGRMRWFTQIGLGTKYLITNHFELEISYGNFLWSKRDGAGQIFNLGVRILK